MTRNEREDAAYKIGFEHHETSGGFREDAEKLCPYRDPYLRNCWLRGWQDAKNQTLNSHE